MRTLYKSRNFLSTLTRRVNPQSKILIAAPNRNRYCMQPSTWRSSLLRTLKMVYEWYYGQPIAQTIGFRWLQRAGRWPGSSLAKSTWRRHRPVTRRICIRIQIEDAVIRMKMNAQVINFTSANSYDLSAPGCIFVWGFNSKCGTYCSSTWCKNMKHPLLTRHHYCTISKPRAPPTYNNHIHQNY